MPFDAVAWLFPCTGPERALLTLCRTGRQVIFTGKMQPHGWPAQQLEMKLGRARRHTVCPRVFVKGYVASASSHYYYNVNSPGDCTWSTPSLSQVAIVSYIPVLIHPSIHPSIYIFK
jgi:hypothetical protein